MITVDMIVEKYRELASDWQRRGAVPDAAAVASFLAWRRAHGGDRADKIERFRAEVSAKDHVEQLASYLGMFVSHERIGPLWRALVDEPIDIFWPVFIHWWNKCDATWASREIIIDTLRHRAADRPGVEFLDGDDRRFFDKLSWPLRVYRGCGRRCVRGISWTIDRERAELFARGGRFGVPRDPVVATAEVEKTDVFFVSAQRGEDEIVLDPYKVRRLRLEPLGLPTLR
jgi:hypothetical protein